MTSSTANQLQLTRNQFAVIAHNDAESVRQLERLFAMVQALSSSTTSSPSADVDLSAGDAVLTRALAPGRYMVGALLLLDGATTVTKTKTATATGALLASYGAIAADTFTEVIDTAAGIFFSGSGGESVALDGVITVTAAGTFGVTVSGTGNLLEGSYFSATRLL